MQVRRFLAGDRPPPVADSIPYGALALMLLERHGADLAERLADAVDTAANEVRDHPSIVEAIGFGAALTERQNPTADLSEQFAGMSAVHTLDNLAVVVWALLRHHNDLSAVIGETVPAGWAGTVTR